MRHEHFCDGSMVFFDGFTRISADSADGAVKARFAALSLAHNLCGHDLTTLLELAASDVSLGSTAEAVKEVWQSARRLRSDTRACRTCVGLALRSAGRAVQAPRCVYPGREQLSAADARAVIRAETASDLLIAVRVLIDCALEREKLYAEWWRENVETTEFLERHAKREGGMSGFISRAFSLASSCERSLLRHLRPSAWTQFAIGIELLPVPATREKFRSQVARFSTELRRYRLRAGDGPKRAGGRRVRVPFNSLEIPTSITIEWEGGDRAVPEERLQGREKRTLRVVLGMRPIRGGESRSSDNSGTNQCDRTVSFVFVSRETGSPFCQGGAGSEAAPVSSGGRGRVSDLPERGH
jgi:hypothetical protein